MKTSKVYTSGLLKYLKVFIALQLLVISTTALPQKTFKYNFTSNCFDAVIHDLSQEYNILYSELMYIDNELSIFDFIVLSKSNKRLLIVREVKGKTNFVCVLSDFSHKTRM